MQAKQQVSATLRILRQPEVSARTGLSRPSLYRLMREHRFPLNLKLSGSGGRAAGWLESEVDQFIAARVAESRKVAA